MDRMDGYHIGQRSSKSTSGSNNGPAPAFAKKENIYFVVANENFVWTQA